ncbi:MAG: hypothetical protein D3916_13415, partial [Candidatus Electrothrix sp. MAN1_4]|nr:hypothetical protein [Candidatus Electrothrix sp. MAN1_4]
SNAPGYDTGEGTGIAETLEYTVPVTDYNDSEKFGALSWLPDDGRLGQLKGKFSVFITAPGSSRPQFTIWTPWGEVQVDDGYLFDNAEMIKSVLLFLTYLSCTYIFFFRG